MVFVRVVVQAIAQNHPEGPFEITDEQYGACRGFLANFNTTYSLNYDLLLYWVLMHTEMEPAINNDDGFRTPEDEEDADYVTWEVENTDRQNIFYLHGALHFFDEPRKDDENPPQHVSQQGIPQLREDLSIQQPRRHAMTLGMSTYSSDAVHILTDKNPTHSVDFRLSRGRESRGGSFSGDLPLLCRASASQECVPEKATRFRH